MIQKLTSCKGSPKQGLKNCPKVHWSRNLLVLKNFLLVLNIGMEEIKFVEHKINLPPLPVVVTQ
jgi:hypothetical protein